MTRPDEIMDRARRNRVILDALAGRNRDENAARELAGFLDVMRPDMDEDRVRKIVTERRDRGKENPS